MTISTTVADYVLYAQDPNNGTLRNVTYAEILFTLKSDVGWLVPGFAFLSGILLMITLTIMVLCSMPFVRKSGCFQVRNLTFVKRKQHLNCFQRM